jgi:steroid 5-alpha reductase family enzyme
MAFKSRPENKGRLLTSGLWSMTRHPNYFGDAVVWWSFFVLALSSPVDLWLVYAPILMTFFLLRVSGVSLLEKSLKQNKLGYEEYMHDTPAFVPDFFKRPQL